MRSFFFPFIVISFLSSYFNVIWLNGRQTLKPEEDLGHSHHIFLAIGNNAIEVAVFPVDLPDSAAIDIILRSWNAESESEKIQRSVILEVAEFPKFHGIYMRNLPEIGRAHV